MPDSVFFLPLERVPPVLLSEKGHFFVAEGWWQRSFSGKFLNNLLNGQFYTIKAVADISVVQVRGVRLIHEIGSCGIGLVMGRFSVFHGQGVPRFAVARIGSEVMEK